MLYCTFIKLYTFVYTTNFKGGLNMKKAQTEYLSYKKAMEILGLSSYQTLTAYIKAGLPVIEVANSKRIKKSDLDAFMTSHYVNSKEA